MLTHEKINKIERALGFKLYPDVVANITQRKGITKGRKTGSTTAYILNLVLNRRDPIDMKDLKNGLMSDMTGNSLYNKHFTTHFLKTRYLLEQAGFDVVEIKNINNRKSKSKEYLNKERKQEPSRLEVWGFDRFAEEMIWNNSNNIKEHFDKIRKGDNFILAKLISGKYHYYSVSYINQLFNSYEEIVIYD